MIPFDDPAFLSERPTRKTCILCLEAGDDLNDENVCPECVDYLQAQRDEQKDAENHLSIKAGSDDT